MNRFAAYTKEVEVRDIIENRGKFFGLQDLKYREPKAHTEEEMSVICWITNFVDSISIFAKLNLC